MTPNLRGLPYQTSDAGVMSDVYTYDENRNVRGIADLQQGVTSRTMEYDELDRLWKANAPGLWGNGEYAYDDLNNLTATAISGGLMARSTTHAFNPLTNRLTGITSPTAAYNINYEYDLQGNIIKRGSQTYAFDLGNRMKSAAGKATYAYDGLGHRVSVVGIDGVNRIQVYTQAGQLLYGGPVAGDGTKYIYLKSHLLAQVSPSGVSYSHTDGLGSPVARTNEAGALACRTRYEPYGQVAAGATQTIGFTGHVNDVETGLTYMQQRYYDPIAGRFLSIDPVITDANTGASFNRYFYANNSPYSFVDPDGREARGIEINCTAGCETWGSGHILGKSPAEIWSPVHKAFGQAGELGLQKAIRGLVLDSPFERMLYERFLDGSGAQLLLTLYQFQDIVAQSQNVGKPTQTTLSDGSTGLSQSVSLYNSP
ncbi:MAG: RHS repeat-associated core domain-containing protein [Telluria sp.]